MKLDLELIALQQFLNIEDVQRSMLFGLAQVFLQKNGMP